MAGLEIHPLSELRDEAAALLAERFARQRSAQPLLPEVDDFASHLPEDGHVATRGGEPVAYLGGAVDERTEMARWLFGGHAAREPDALRDLFAIQADEFGVRRFMVTVPATDEELIDAWFSLGFGCSAVWAARRVATAEPVEFGGTIRAATPDDTEAIVDFDVLLYEHQAASPSFSEFATPPRDDLRAEAAEIWESDAYLPFLAEQHGRAVGMLGLYRRPEGDLRVPAHNIDLAFMAVDPELRGSGVGLALTAYAHRFAADNGFHSMTVDWRSTNLLSSRFWPRRGFRGQYLRLYRAVP